MVGSLVLCVVASYTMGALAQPPTCLEDGHCNSGYYCVPDLHKCQSCLSCEAFNREPPTEPTSCVKSVVDCGSCMKGLVPDISGDASCRAPDAHSDSLPWYAWLIISVLVLLVLLALVALCRLLRGRKFDSKMFILATRPREPPGREVPPTAPPEQPPPPYYDGPASRNGYSLPIYDRELRTPDQYPHNTYTEESEQPLVKQAPAAGWPARGPEQAGRQDAQPFNSPSYVRNSQITDNNVNNVTDSEAEEPASPELHDEDTTPSPWTPAAALSNGDANHIAAASGDSMEAGAIGSRPFAVLRRPSHPDLSPPPPKLHRGDSNNNRNQDGGGEGSSQPSGGTNVIINVLNAGSLHSYQNLSL